jgi:hypothetical protein
MLTFTENVNVGVIDRLSNPQLVVVFWAVWGVLADLYIHYCPFPPELVPGGFIIAIIIGGFLGIFTHYFILAFRRIARWLRRITTWAELSNLKL